MNGTDIFANISFWLHVFVLQDYKLREIVESMKEIWEKAEINVKLSFDILAEEKD